MSALTLEKLMSDMKAAGLLDEKKDVFDPFSLRLFGMDVIKSRDFPVYELPPEVIPGVPWPPGFREDVNRWSVWFLGTRNTVPRGMVFALGNRLVMRSEDVVRISNIC